MCYKYTFLFTSPLYHTQAHQKSISQLKDKLSALPSLDTEGQLSDLSVYYHTVTELRATSETLQVENIP